VQLLTLGRPGSTWATPLGASMTGVGLGMLLLGRWVVLEVAAI